MLLKSEEHGEAPAVDDRPPVRRPDPNSLDTPAAPDRGRVLPHRRRLRLVLFLLLPLVLIGGGYLYLTGGGTVSTDDARVSSDIVAVSTDVSGIVEEVHVRDNQQVAAGQVLFRLDPLPFRLKLDMAEAQLGTVRDDLNAQKAQYRNVETQIGRANADLAYRQRLFDRQQALFHRGVASAQAFDQARHDLKTAQQTIAGLQQQLAATAARLGGNPNLPLEQYPSWRAAAATRDEARRELSHATIRAPFAGIVTKVPSLQPGMYLKAATPGVSVVSTDHLWVEAQPKETKLTYVRPGQPATITVDAYPGRVWHGTVASISPASNSEFSLLPAENTSGNWVKVVQRIPVRVQIDAQGGDTPPLRAGMSAEVTIDTGHRRSLGQFASSLWRDLQSLWQNV